jgi:hypothetical protein
MKRISPQRTQRTQRDREEDDPQITQKDADLKTKNTVF